MTEKNFSSSMDSYPKQRFYFYIFSLILLGFNSGIPFLLTLSTLTVRLTEEGYNKTTIGLFMFTTLPYSLKFLWAPLLDRCSLPFFTQKFGLRRGWSIFAQMGLILSVLILGLLNPKEHQLALGVASFLVCFFAATQDSVIDAYRIELIPSSQMGIAAAASSIGFRLGMLTSGAGALYLADAWGWGLSYISMGLLMGTALIIILLLPEPSLSQKDKALSYDNLSWPILLKSMFILPFQAFQFKDRLILLLFFVFFFKTADSMLNFLSAPLLYDLGFSKIDFANITKVYGIALMVLGGIFGGLYIRRFGIYSCLILCLILQMLTCFIFSILAHLGHDSLFLILSIGFENLVSGITATAFITYLSQFCTPPYTASHFTLLYSFGSLGRTVMSFVAGTMADSMEWATLFLACVLLCVPSLIAVLKLKKSLDVDTSRFPR